MFPKAVSTMVGGMSPPSRRRCRKPKPSRPGMFKSVRITSAENSLSLSSASLPSAAVSGVMPHAATIAARPERWLDSSSTIKTFSRWFKERFLPRGRAVYPFYAAGQQKCYEAHCEHLDEQRPASGRIWSLAISRRLRRIGGACFSGATGAAGLNKNVPPNRRKVCLVNHCKQMGAQMSLPGERSSPRPTLRSAGMLKHAPPLLMKFRGPWGDPPGLRRGNDKIEGNFNVSEQRRSTRSYAIHANRTRNDRGKSGPSGKAPRFRQPTLRPGGECRQRRDRKSTRLNSSHLGISYA